MNEIYVKTAASGKSNSAPTMMPGGSIFIPNMKRYERLALQDIRFVKGDKSHVTLHLINGHKKSVSTHLGNFMRYLDVDWFVRISRSYVVNLRYIETVTTRSITVADVVLPLTEPYRTGLWERLPIVRLKSD